MTMQDDLVNMAGAAIEYNRNLLEQICWSLEQQLQVAQDIHDNEYECDLIEVQIASIQWALAIYDMRLAELSQRVRN